MERRQPTSSPHPRTQHRRTPGTSRYPGKPVAPRVGQRRDVRQPSQSRRSRERQPDQCLVGVETAPMCFHAPAYSRLAMRVRRFDDREYHAMRPSAIMSLHSPSARPDSTLACMPTNDRGVPAPAYICVPTNQPLLLDPTPRRPRAPPTCMPFAMSCAPSSASNPSALKKRSARAPRMRRDVRSILDAITRTERRIGVSDESRVGDDHAVARLARPGRPRTARLRTRHSARRR